MPEKIDVSQVEKALKETSLNTISITKKILRSAGRKASKLVNQSLRSSTHGNGLIAGRYPHRLSYTFHVGKNNLKVAIYPKKIEEGRKNDLTVPVISTLNYGNRIEAKQKYMTISGKWGFARVKNVTIQGKHFMESGENYLNSSSMTSDAQQILDSELKKYWG